METKEFLPTKPTTRRKRFSALILHHFFYPDDGVSSHHFSDLAEELQQLHWDVTVLTSNRYSYYPKKKLLQNTEVWRGVKVIRTYRPGWDQANKYGRLASCLWIMLGWIFHLRKIPKVDAVIVGSNPQFAALIFPILRYLQKGKFFVHWCHDLYPEAIIADGATGLVKALAQGVTPFMKWAYKSVDVMVDIGSCMRRRLETYEHKAHCTTLVPWAFIEMDRLQEPDISTRQELFGDARIALLYSGSMGKAHDFSLFLRLARKIYPRDPKITFCFAGRGIRFNELQEAINPEDHNIRISSFVEESELAKRLNVADMHLMSLRPGWEGVVVPSKFFASLAVGKPIIYTGPESSCIAEWIRQLNIGLVLTEKNVDEVVDKLLEISHNTQKLRTWRENALRNYQLLFSKKHILGKWERLLREYTKRSGVS